VENVEIEMKNDLQTNGGRVEKCGKTMLYPNPRQPIS
jgi:hypothetical protein